MNAMKPFHASTLPPRTPHGQIRHKNIPFTIHPSITRDFLIDGDLSKVHNWRSKVHIGKTGNGRKGSWDHVGHILISLDSSNIIPIAISDGLSCGHELLHYFYYPWNLPREHYIAVYSEGYTFLREDSIDQSIEAYRRFRAYGGNNLRVIHINETDDCFATMDDFITFGGQSITKMPSLAQIGTSIRTCAVEIAELIAAENDNAFWRGHDFIGLLDELRFMSHGLIHYSDAELSQAHQTIEDAWDVHNFTPLARLFTQSLQYPSPIHRNISTMLELGRDWKRTMVAVHAYKGRMDLARTEFNRLSETWDGTGEAPRLSTPTANLHQSSYEQI